MRSLLICLFVSLSVQAHDHIERRRATMPALPIKELTDRQDYKAQLDADKKAGRYAVICFWSAHCRPCQIMRDECAKAAPRLPSDKFRIYTVGDEETIRAIWDRRGSSGGVLAIPPDGSATKDLTIEEPRGALEIQWAVRNLLRRPERTEDRLK